MHGWHMERVFVNRSSATIFQFKIIIPLGSYGRATNPGFTSLSWWSPTFLVTFGRMVVLVILEKTSRDKRIDLTKLKSIRKCHQIGNGYRVKKITSKR